VTAVEPGGGRVALVEPGDGDSTIVVDVDTRTGSVSRHRFEGTVEPEAYALDRSRLFAARIYEDRYHVHVLDLASNEQYPTLGPDKQGDPEDMYGSVVQAVPSPDGSQLATLYRDSSTPRHTAFVHLPSLDTGFTVCIDLHEPFGTGERRADAIEWRPDGTVAVGHRADDPAASMTATFEPAAIWSGEPQEHYHAAALPDADPPSLPPGVAGVDGFVRFVTMAAAPPA
jgi:hypothetical protein